MEIIKNNFNNIESETNLSFREILMTAMQGMAIGFFATLIIGTVLGELGKLISYQELIDRTNDLKTLTPIGVGAGIAYKLKLKPLHGLAIVVVAAIGGGYGNLYGELVSTYIAVIIGLYLIYMIDGKQHQYQIFTLPVLGFAIGFGCRLFIYPNVSEVITLLGEQIKVITDLAPLVMGPLLGLIMGFILTSPISSAAIAFALSMSGIAAGSAMAGTSAQMISFGLMTYLATRKVGSSVAVGFGSSMLQFKNVVNNFKLIIIPIIASFTSGLLAAIFEITSVKEAAGMGTSSMIGPLLSINDNNIVIVMLITIALPIGITLLLYPIFTKKKWFKNKDFEY